MEEVVIKDRINGNWSYDQEADVLYIAFDSPKIAETIGPGKWNICSDGS